VRLLFRLQFHPLFIFVVTDWSNELEVDSSSLTVDALVMLALKLMSMVLIAI
jgi:hypothetical protein